MPGDQAERVFIDSNIWLYALLAGSEYAKEQTARNLVNRSVVVSIQVVNEVCFNLREKGSLPEENIRRLIQSFHADNFVVPITQAAQLSASTLRERYSFSFWDSLIVAAALEASCDRMFSEDMQHGLVVDGMLIIEKPFSTA